MAGATEEEKKEYLLIQEGKAITNDDCLSALIEIDSDIAGYQSLRSMVGKKLAKYEKKIIDLKQEQQTIDDRLRYLRSIKTTIRMLLSKS